jgi:hypothetical protein
MRFFRLSAMAISATIMALAAVATAADAPLFPFVVSYDAPRNATNVSGWLDSPAGGHGFVRAVGGRMATDAGPIRFWATNLCFEADFPSHDEAQRLAARLARLGINCVRLHHMDMHSIWGNSPNHLTIDPEKLERLDYLISQFKLHGVYVDINLHVSRWFGEAEGFTAQSQRPNFDKGLDNFEPRMIELQKKYARDLLGHVNPYTGHAYTDEPAVAMVEINNENALFDEWNRGSIDRLPEPYAGTFRRLWNGWLQKKYGDTTALAKAWNRGQQALGAEMLRSDLSQPEKTWGLERDEKTVVQWSTQPDGPEGKPYLHVVVGRRGKVAWLPQFAQSGLTVAKGSVYTLRFRVRSPDAHRLGVGCRMAHDPWDGLGLQAEVDLTSQWQEQSLSFVASLDDAKARIIFSDLGPGTFDLAAISLRPGGIAGLPADQRLEDQSVAPLHHSRMDLTETARNDFVDFLHDTERDYWWGMYRFLKNDLHVRPMVAGTQLGWSPVHVQAGLDYCDSHSYWHHPSFPGRPWDSRNWYVENAALVNTPGGTLSGLAGHRVAGKPFTVSEYNHPLPIVYAAEGFPMIAAFGGFQGWDAIFSFAYSHDRNYEPRRLTSFFDIKEDPVRLVHMPACVAMFVRGDVAPARTLIRVPLDAEAEKRQLHQTQSPWTLTTDHLGLDPREAILHAVALDIGPTATSHGPQLPQPAAGVKEFVSDTGQIRWNVAEPGAGYFVVDSPRCKLFTGFVHGRTFHLGDVTLEIGPTRLDWATVSLVAIDGAGCDAPGRLLLSASGVEQNRGAALESLGGDRVTLRDHWGDEPVLCEGIAARIFLPVASDRVRCYPLDESGNRRTAAAVGSRDGRAVLGIGPEYRTLWYEVEIR